MVIKKLKNYFIEEKKSLPIVLVIISLGSFFLHLKFNKVPDFNGFLLWLPITWIITTSFMLGFKIFLDDGGNN